MKCAENWTDIQFEQLFDLLAWLKNPCGVSALATLNSTFQYYFILIFVVSSLSSVNNWSLNSGLAQNPKPKQSPPNKNTHPNKTEQLPPPTNPQNLPNQTNTDVLSVSPPEWFDFSCLSSLDFFFLTDLNESQVDDQKSVHFMRSVFLVPTFLGIWVHFMLLLNHM